MSREEIRLEVLKLLKLPDIANPDLAPFLERAKTLEAYVVGAGQAERPSQNASTYAPQARNNQQSSGPAHRK